MNIKDIAIGEKREVSHFSNDLIGSKLMSMGIKPGSIIEVIRTTNNNKTYYLKANSHRIAIRENEAVAIELK